MLMLSLLSLRLPTQKYIFMQKKKLEGNTSPRIHSSDPAGPSSLRLYSRRDPAIGASAARYASSEVAVMVADHPLDFEVKDVSLCHVRFTRRRERYTGTKESSGQAKDDISCP
jgi:hypothetical protein